jgi:hypothetical protein
LKDLIDFGLIGPDHFILQDESGYLLRETLAAYSGHFSVEDVPLSFESMVFRLTTLGST